MNKSELAQQLLNNQKYQEASQLYQTLIETEPNNKTHYWYLGLSLLLQSQETEAQTIWFLALSEDDFNTNIIELSQILEQQATNLETIANQSSWIIRQHLHSIDPTNTHNLLKLLDLGIKLDQNIDQPLSDIIEILNTQNFQELNPTQLIQTWWNIISHNPNQPSTLELTRSLIPYITDSSYFLLSLLEAIIQMSDPILAIQYGELALQLDINPTEILPYLAKLYQKAGQYQKGIETATRYLELAQNLLDKIHANHILLTGLMLAGGYWEQAKKQFEIQISLFKQLINQDITLDRLSALRLINSLFPLPYFQDAPQSNRAIINQISALCQKTFTPQTHHPKIRQSKIRIGYLSSYLIRHSVGWLSRWVFKYHNRSDFEIYLYLINAKNKIDPLQDWIINQADHAYKLGNFGQEIADQITQDDIDILIDLDSLTVDISCEVLALKPAPIQMTWLGWDASGLPTVDYFIADPYVLPPEAPNYYQEKIITFPSTYIAVDGFEIGVPTLTRSDLNISPEAIIYLTSQTGLKRNLDLAKLQLKIIKQVPNSYLLIKGLSDLESVKKFFTNIANQEQIESDRLKFLDLTETEETHRANLSIVDIVLDTYPYSGATTTLETLWMGIPIVTKVGQQFSARNSYSMMINAGLTEGIAWTDQEYITWGIILGTDPTLREQISLKLKKSRQTSPLWNAKQFTQQLETHYRALIQN